MRTSIEITRGVRRAALVAMSGLACATGRASAQTTDSATVARSALAAAYLRMDQAYSAATLSDSMRARINRQFDRSTLSFFVGKFGAALAAIDSATMAITGAPIPPAPSPLPRLVNERAPSVARDRFLVRLAKLDSVGPLAQSIADAKARAQLLVDVPSPERSAEFLSDPAQIARDLAREVGVLERGRNPYVGQPGDSWHSYRGAAGALIPMRIVAPAAAAVSARPVPVIIALHGAGGDENMFVNAYGQGIIAAMAAEARAILVTPATTAFAASPANFDSLLVVLRATYRIDDQRIYVLGHSLGAGIAARLAQSHPQLIAGVACLAGGAVVKTPNAPPMLFLGAALDPIIPAARVQAFAKDTPTATYQVLENEGHTLMVRNGVRRALPWLLTQHR
jgi:predicted esterase